MSRLRSKCLIGLTWGALLCQGMSAGAQTSPKATTPSPTRLGIYLRGDAIPDTASLHAGIGFISLVDDSLNADVLVVLSVDKSEGGEVYRMIFRGGRLRTGRSDTLTRVISPGSSSTDRMQTIVAAMKLGLLPYVTRLQIGRLVRVEFLPTAPAAEPAAPEKDPWDRWVVSLGMSGSVNAQKQSRNDYLYYSGGVGRTSDKARFDLTYYMSTAGSRYDVGDERLVSRTKSTSASTVGVWRLTPRWGVGIAASTTASTVMNQRRTIAAAPAIEWSIFPYNEFTRRLFVAQYAVGGEHYRYVEETIYGKMHETLAKHRLSIGYNATRGWGSDYVSVVASQYLADPSKQRVTASASTSLKITTGLNLSGGASYAIIHDQLSLPRGAASVEDVLLARRQLATSYQYSLSLGFTYLFGSKAPSVPNPRLSYGASAASSVMF